MADNPSPKRLEGERLVAPDIGRDGAVPVAMPLPKLAAMVSLSDSELLAVLERLGITDTTQQMLEDTRRYVARLTRIPPGSPAFASEVERLLSQDDRRGLVGITRRAQERYTTLQALDGSDSAMLIRISEGDTHVCEDCAMLEGYVGNYEEQAAIGLPGAQSCRGGDYCRCQLVLVRDS
jgi:hypothetical protein